MSPKKQSSLKGWFEFEGNLYNLRNVIMIKFDENDHIITLEYIGNDIDLEVSGKSKKQVFENYEDLVATICVICGE